MMQPGTRTGKIEADLSMVTTTHLLQRAREFCQKGAAALEYGEMDHARWHYDWIDELLEELQRRDGAEK